jgi:hypothetical protein
LVRIRITPYFNPYKYGFLFHTFFINY